MIELPLLTNDLPGIGGVVKQRVEDFRVEEVPLSEEGGRGRHAHFLVVKSGVTTQTAAERIARHLRVPPGEIGYAGMKDAQAVTSQWMSLQDADDRRLKNFRDKQVRIADLRWRGQKLRAGHLAGNRFSIRVREVGPEQLAAAQRIMSVLVRRGVPNYFGQQRFGTRGDNAKLGEALIRGELDEFVGLFLGRPAKFDPPDCRAARAAFDHGALGEAMKRWPGRFVEQRRALGAFRQRRRPKDVVAAVDKRIKRLFISAFQSEVFNEVLARRIQTIDQVLAGDLAESVGGRFLQTAVSFGGVSGDSADKWFLVADAAAEQSRVAGFQISPTGPMPGCDCPLAEEGSTPGQIERAVLKKRGIDMAMFAQYRPLNITGGRRPLRYRPGEVALTAGADRHGPYVQLAFTAPAGCYATVLLDEVLKVRQKGEEL